MFFFKYPTPHFSLVRGKLECLQKDIEYRGKKLNVNKRIDIFI